MILPILKEGNDEKVESMLGGELLLDAVNNKMDHLVLDDHFIQTRGKLSRTSIQTHFALAPQ